ncbi:MAG: DUF4390 domain-containing protein [Desulfobacterales bacterium]|nr:MAG: DUF4390 domain-containing protein [Desulfobacterales bacterium]
MSPLMNRKTYIILFCLMFLVQNLAFAQEAKLTDIIVTNTRDDLLVYMNVEGAFREKMQTAVLSGVPTTFSFFITLFKARNLWFDKKIADIKVTHTVKYNNLKKEFMVKRSWENGEPLVTQSFTEVKELMTEIDSLKIAPLSALEKGLNYQIRAKAELSKLTLPFYLHHVFIFLSLWDFETDLYTIDFIY